MSLDPDYLLFHAPLVGLIGLSDLKQPAPVESLETPAGKRAQQELLSYTIKQAFCAHFLSQNEVQAWEDKKNFKSIFINGVMYCLT